MKESALKNGQQLGGGLANAFGRWMVSIGFLVTVFLHSCFLTIQFWSFISGESRSDPAKAFTCFVTALKRYPAYAPAFTSLGLFYDWVADPPDALRASKCFQKAFELDAREHEAARRLAEGFADEREWDLVEVVARRTVEGEGGADALGGVAASQRRHMSRNAWAWKAIGAVELHRHKYEAAINAFQIALRASPDEASTWQRLGEAYAASGRHVAALKTFAKARVLAPGEWQIEYSTADLQRQLGEFDEAVTGFERILSDRPDELGVRVALAETRLMQGRGEYATGYVARAEHSYARALADSLVALQDDLHLRSGWKIVADACYELTKFGTLKDLEHILSSAVTPLLDLTQPEEVDAKLPSVSVVTLECARAALSAPEERPLLLASIFFYKLRVLLNAADDNVAGSAWADLATALYAFGRSASDAVQTSEESERNRLSLRQAIGCIKQALKHEPGNENFWLALGNLTFGHGVKLAQHSYIRAIENSPRVRATKGRNVQVWLLNLNLLCYRRIRSHGLILVSCICKRTMLSSLMRLSSELRR